VVRHSALRPRTAPPPSSRRRGPAPADAAGSILALQRAAGNAAVSRAIASRVIQRMKEDAEEYITTNALGIEATHASVKAYVGDTSKRREHRLGLLEAWNKGRTGGSWFIAKPADLAAPANPFHHSQFAVYQDFTKSTTGVKIDIFGGQVSAFYNQGAPKIGSRQTDWSDAPLGDKYVDYVDGLRSNGMTDPQIATALLTLDDSTLTSALEKRAAAMLTITVYLAEEWRKQGAAKIYRAILRTIEAGTKTFDDLVTDFQYVSSAQEGRKQAARFQDVWLGAAPISSLSAPEQQYYNVMSPVQHEDFSSDDDMRTDTKKNLTGKRLWAQHHK
jgi:hypothetical protein